VGATSQIITVTQEAGDILLSVSSTVKNIAKEAGSKDSVFVTSNTSWTAASDQLWLVLEPENDSGNDMLVFTAEANPLSTARIANITVAAVGATSQIIVVTQEAGSAISDNFELDNTTISNGESTCFNAYLNITVAGNSAVIFENGSSVNLIAGQSVRFLPGFHAQSGSFMNASITLNNSFCDSRIPISSPIVTQPEKKNLKNERIIKEQTILKAEKSIKVYPNPNNGNFTIELTNFDSNADVYVYNMLGAMVYKSSIENQSNLNINLPEINKGLYFVKVIGENEQFTKKIVVN
ncbi:MAG TPA: T9SS type A sorting domain-containing protein, partial [Prolixibacteraceae bacterium]|nr:T9SS type A sorting domain-containing protein [Prolixibacteraceae bacterium]